jgi:hypothetical protein
MVFGFDDNFHAPSIPPIPMGEIWTAFPSNTIFLEDVMKKLTCWLMVAVFCGAARLVWAAGVGEVNKANSPILPLGQNQKAFGSQPGKVIPVPKKNGTQNVKVSQNPKLNEGAGIYYYFNHTDSKHSLVTGKKGNGGSLTAGGKALPKMNGPQEGGQIPKTVNKVENESLVNFNEGDPDKPIVTGQTYNGAATTSGRQGTLNMR